MSQAAELVEVRAAADRLIQACAGARCVLVDAAAIDALDLGVRGIARVYAAARPSTPSRRKK